jgi:hypothetical protein
MRCPRTRLTNLRYLTVDYMLAETQSRSYGNNRKASLQESAQLLEDFLTRVDQYGLLSPADRQMYERFLESRSSFRVVSSSDPEEKRKIKIRRFQEEKSLKQKLEVGTVLTLMPPPAH